MTSTCRCGHGRSAHRTSANATYKRRALGLRPTGNLPCQAFLMKTDPATGRQFWGAHAKKCGCRNWHPVEVGA